MASRPVKLKLLRRSTMKAKSVTVFPARVVGENGIGVNKTASVYTIGPDFEAVPALPSLSAADRDNVFVLALNTDTGIYSRISADVILGLGTIGQAWDADLQALADNSTNGLWAHTGAGIGSARTLTAPAAGITISNGDGVSGNPTLVLANDLAALEGLGSTGIAVRTAADAWSQRTLTGTAAEITVTFGDGVSGNPTISIPAAVTFTGKTVTGGTFSGPAITTPSITGAFPFRLRAQAGAGFDMEVKNSEALTANRTLTISLSDADRTLTLGGNLTLAGAVSLPTVAQGDIWYGSASGVKSALAKDTNATRYLSNTGTSNNPAWGQVNLANGVTGKLPMANIGTTGTPSATTFLRGDDSWATPAGAGDFVGPGSSTDNAAVRFDTTTGKLGQNSALLIADTTGSLSRSGGGGIPHEGTNTNDSAAAGYVGEVISSTIASGSAVSLTNNSPANMTSISLTAGDWDVYLNVIFLTTGTTTYNYLLGSIGTTTATVVVAGGQYASATYATAGIANSNLTNIGLWCGPYRASLSGTTTIYGVAQAGFSASTVGVFGQLFARRRR